MSTAERIAGADPRSKPAQPEARRVAVLPDDLANQIAAGEVVERPASVVKELVENALDAGARRIRVDIEGGGVGLVRIADDGRGMSREDASLAVLRHATSKIARIDDLRCIQSFGFRGEALPSIASVSRFSLRTRRDGESEGTEIRIEGGGPTQVVPCGCAVGTVVEVRDLFYNVPARRKFLRAVGTESAHVTEIAQAVALGEPGVTLVLSRDGRVAREWLRTASRAERARAMLAGEELATCAGQRGPLTVEAFVSRPERARSGAGWLWMFVNGRHVRDRSLARSIALAYGSVLEPGRYPIGAVFIDLPPELVDVNVHPQKAEVRFADGRAVADALYKIVAAQVAAAFGLPAPAPGGFQGRKGKLFEDAASPPGDAWVWSSGPSAGAPAAGAPSERQEPPADPWGLGGDLVGIPPGRPEAARPGSATSGVGAPAQLGVWDDIALPERRDGAVGPAIAPGAPGIAPEEPAAALGGPANVPGGLATAQGGPAAVPGGPANVPGAPPVPYPTGSGAVLAAAERVLAWKSLRFLAQVRNTYFVCEGPDGIYFLDQHAAAERVTFHRLRAAYDGRDVATQKLLFPVLVPAAPAEVSLVEEAQEAIARLGLDVRPAGAAQLAVHAVPTLLRRAAPERLVRDLVDELSHSGERAFSGAVDLALATMACHGSLRAGDPVAPDEARALLAALDEVDFAGHCPHGRPIVMRVGWPELEHRVGRR
ncbi:MULTISPECIES: DNA mismatch repair endonuclease MutL [Sorangium]|uniref:DNA mismatch repair protein MutL n=1 Tax=Sorangium cellulosum TaxID=56 RepID=A0A4P2R692_SORCE|nr:MULTISPECIES: DNA mismatch repair endonuclease MutL [Sorangium]AUX38356.1 DNA mismatch repair protein MutL [Sorangium cellulosum]WCQ97644.1 DNA mismatch repair protein MutL [Sorangium sp. Soce836]